MSFFGGGGQQGPRQLDLAKLEMEIITDSFNK